MILSKENLYRKSLDTTMKVIGLNKKNHLEISNTLPDGARDAMQFSPALVVNGEQLISGSSGWGLQPRSVIGQTKDGEMLLAIVDGRQPAIPSASRLAIWRTFCISTARIRRAIWTAVRLRSCTIAAASSRIPPRQIPSADGIFRTAGLSQSRKSKRCKNSCFGGSFLLRASGIIFFRSAQFALHRGQFMAC